MSVATPGPAQIDVDQSIELAGELVREWCLAQVRDVAALGERLHEGAFSSGFATACEELECRLSAATCVGILDQVTEGVRAAQAGEEG